MNGIPPDPDAPDDVDDRYRRASALDPSRPGAAVRSAILEHATKLAAQRAGNTDEKAAPTVATMRPAQFPPWRRRATFGTLAAAALAGLLIVPRLLPPRQDSQQKTAINPAPRAPSTEAPLAGAPVAGAQVPAAPRNEPAPPNFVADEMRSPSADAASAPSAQVQNIVRGRLAQLQASARARFALPAPSLPPPPAPSTSAASAAPATPAAPAQVQSVTVAAARRTEPAAALRQAAEAGDMAALHTLLSPQTDIDQPADIERSADIDARDSSGRTALMLATQHGRRAAVDALLAAGADPNAADAHGTTPLQAAIAAGQPDIIAALQRAGAR